MQHAARVALLAAPLLATHCDAGIVPWAALEGLLRRVAPPAAVDACVKIGATLEALQRDRPERRGSAVVDLLLLRELDKDEDDEATDVPDPRFVRFAWRHASAAYGFPFLKPLGLLKGVNPETLGELSLQKLDALCVAARCGGDARLVEGGFRTAPLSGDVAAPAFYVATCPGRVVLAIRGTADVGDALTDLVCEAAPLRDGGAAHEGVLRAAEGVLAAAGPALLAALDEAGDRCDLVVTGHSMGGGAALLVGRLLDDLRTTPPAGPWGPAGSVVARRLEEGGHRVRAVAFSPPPVATVSAPSPRTTFESYCVGGDVVPTLSLRSVKSLVAAVDAIDEALEFRERVGLLTDAAGGAAAAAALRKSGLFPGRAERAEADATSASRRIRDRLRPVLAALRRGDTSDDDAAAAPLAIPGGCVRISRSGDATLDPSLPVVRVRDGAVVDHFLPVIEEVLEKLVAQASLLDGSDPEDRPVRRPQRDL